MHSLQELGWKFFVDENNIFYFFYILKIFKNYFNWSTQLIYNVVLVSDI